MNNLVFTVAIGTSNNVRYIVDLTYQGLACAWRSKQQQPLWWAPQSCEYVSEGQIHVQIQINVMPIACKYMSVCLYDLLHVYYVICRTKGRIISFTCSLLLLTNKYTMSYRVSFFMIMEVVFLSMQLTMYD